MQTSQGSQKEPPLVEIDNRGQTFETYITSTDAVAEAAYLIREVLVDDCYLQHGLQITPGATVVDIGANIGLFAVRALAAVPGGDVTYIGVEPVPANFTALQYNLLGSTASAGSTCSTACAAAGACEAGSAGAGRSFCHFNAAYAAAVAPPTAARISRPYPGNIRLFNTAVSNKPGHLPLTYYPRMPGNSTLRPTEKAALQQRLMPSFFSAVERFEVPVITLQQLLQEAVPDGRMVDLLKVDVEGEEWAVLPGLDEAGWQRVRQVVVEVHDCLPGALDERPAGWASHSAGEHSSPRQHTASPGRAAQSDYGTTAAAAALDDDDDDGCGGDPARASGPQPESPAGQRRSDIDGDWISFWPRDLPSRDTRGRPLMQAAAPPRHDGRVMAVARMLKGLGFKVVVECCMLLQGVPVNYNVYARRPELSG
eukprot:GHRQ01009172.1.p1 GENE.GHRQ01009172.1~~GHRQ01009172.1.p1  ORF type:complete len:425 (+),score=86.47 GHRQ01009172.1:136-1410(+)